MSFLLFLSLLHQMLTDFSNIWYYCSWANLQPNDIFLSYNIQFVYEYYRISKQDSVNVVVRSRSSWSNVTTSFCHHTSFSHDFLKSLYSPRTPQPLFGNSCIKFKNVQLY